MEDDPIMYFRRIVGEQWNKHVLPQTLAEGGSGKTKERRKVRDKTGWWKAKVGISEICCWVCPLFVTLQIQWRCKNRLENSSEEKNLYPYIPLSCTFFSSLVFGFSVTWTDLSTYKSSPLPTSLVCYFMCFCIICRVCFDLHSSWMCGFLFGYQKENCFVWEFWSLFWSFAGPKYQFLIQMNTSQCFQLFSPSCFLSGKISLNSKWPLHTLIKCPNCNSSWQKWEHSVCYSWVWILTLIYTLILELLSF